MTVVGLIPAAGSAARLQPLRSSKEMIPVRGRPVMEYLVERLRRAQCDEIRLVTRPEKEDVVEHARELDLRVIVATTRTPAESVGAGLVGLAPGDVVLLGFPDTIWLPSDGFVRLLAELTGNVVAVLGLFRTPELERSDVVSMDDDHRVTSVEIKPAQPSSEWIWGCAAVYAEALGGVEAAGEIGRHFGALASRDVVRGAQLSDTWVDVGTKEALRRALADERLDWDRHAQVSQ